MKPFHHHRQPYCNIPGAMYIAGCMESINCASAVEQKIYCGADFQEFLFRGSHGLKHVHVTMRNVSTILQTNIFHPSFVRVKTPWPFESVIDGRYTYMDRPKSIN